MDHMYYFFAGGFLGVRVVLPVDVEGVGTIGVAFTSVMLNLLLIVQSQRFSFQMGLNRLFYNVNTQSVNFHFNISLLLLYQYEC